MYQLLWEEVALDELAQLWLVLKPGEINTAIREIERLLKQAAEYVGESRARASERILIVEPLCIYFHIEYHDRQRIAVVQHVWSSYKPGQ